MASSAPIKLGAKGAGTMVFSNGDSYTGQWQSSRRHGDGQMQYAADGSIYDGQWCSGQRHGSAVLTGADGSTHTGGWQDDLMHGPGVQVTAAGTKLEGSWSQGDLEGDVSFTIRDASGTAQYKAGSLLAAGGGVAVEYFSGDRYNGDFSITSGIRHGQGLFAAVNGDRYDGQWDSDLRSGTGDQGYPDGGSYKGDFRNDLASGHGVFTSANGDTYSGGWRNGLQHGTGALRGIGGDEYEGSFDRGKRHGVGKATYVNGSVYRGLWAHDVRHGQGSHSDSSGGSYDGLWDNDERHGKGRYTSAEGDVFDGTWAHGKRDGEFAVQYTAGDQYNGSFRDDKRDGFGRYIYSGQQQQPGGGQGQSGSRPGSTKIQTMVYIGSWCAGEMDGPGELLLESGHCYKGTWCKGAQVGKGTLWLRDPASASASASASSSLFNNNGLLGQHRVQDSQGHTNCIADLTWMVDRPAYACPPPSTTTTATTSGGSPNPSSPSSPPQPQPPCCHVLYATGCVYVGDFCGPYRHGYGVMTSKCGGSQYSGEWARDVRKGLGVARWNLVPPLDGLGQQAAAVATTASTTQEDEGMAVCPITLGRDGSISTHQFDGHWIDDLPNGRGVATLSDGSLLADWLNGAPTGTVTRTYSVDGSTYSGQFGALRGRHGRGELRFAAGDVYTGEFVDDLPHGQGLVHCASGEQFDGKFEEGMRTGHGEMLSPDGSLYRGEWAGNVQHGRGTVSGGELDGVYEGEWRAGVKSGAGSALFANKDSYAGEWAGGAPNGHGVCRYSAQDGAQDGSSAGRSKMAGQGGRGSAQGGRSSGSDHGQGGGSVYDGEWLNGVPHGSGHLAVPGGADFQGGYEHGSWSGAGVSREANGDTYSGQHRAGQRHGRGVLLYSASASEAASLDSSRPLGILLDAAGENVARAGPGGSAVAVAVAAVVARSGPGLYGVSLGPLQCCYEGEWAHGQRHGEGECHYFDGGSYCGQWAAGLRSGQGILTRADGFVYDGEFEQGLYHGEGRLYFLQGDGGADDDAGGGGGGGGGGYAAAVEAWQASAAEWLQRWQSVPSVDPGGTGLGWLNNKEDELAVSTLTRCLDWTWQGLGGLTEYTGLWVSGVKHGTGRGAFLTKQAGYSPEGGGGGGGEESERQFDGQHWGSAVMLHRGNVLDLLHAVFDELADRSHEDGDGDVTATDTAGPTVDRLSLCDAVRSHPTLSAGFKISNSKAGAAGSSFASLMTFDVLELTFVSAGSSSCNGRGTAADAADADADAALPANVLQQLQQGGNGDVSFGTTASAGNGGAHASRACWREVEALWYQRHACLERHAPLASDQSLIFTGAWLFGRPNGSGDIAYAQPKGGVFRGSVVDGMPQGHGTFRVPVSVLAVNPEQEGQSEGQEEEEEEGEGQGLEEGQNNKQWSSLRNSNKVVEEVYAGQWMHGLQCGSGTCTFAQGDVYEGDWRGGLMDGPLGTLTCSQGQMYTGSWRGGRKEGSGMYISKQGVIHEGQWRDDALHGDGTLSTPEGRQFSGKWDAGKAYGRGRWSMPSGVSFKVMYDSDGTVATASYDDGSVYTGALHLGVRSGNGKLTAMDGSVYKGQFEDDLRQGYGCLTSKPLGGGDGFASTTGDVYTGHFASDLKHGEGKIVLCNGDTYNGEWEGDLRHGVGVLQFASGEHVFDGQWVRDDWVSGVLTTPAWTYNGGFDAARRRHGLGKFTSASGDVYEGQWSEDKRHGLGDCRFVQTGGFFDGGWSNDLFHGFGIFTMGVDEVYTGEWVTGKRCGTGEQKYANGDVYSGAWASDCRKGLGSFRSAAGDQYTGEFDE